MNGSNLETLRAACTDFEAAAKEAIGWVNDEQNAERLQPDRPAIEDDLRRAVFQTRKLSQSVARPMCVGVFGASQAGKSYLVSVLAAKNNELKALFDGDRPEVDFLRSINPTGGEESTGLVTRFTIHPITTPPGFPVAVRLLSQIDIAKILANTFVFESDVEFETPLQRDELDAHIAELERQAGTDYVDTLREEDIWDLQDYFQKYLRKSENTRALDLFWGRLAKLAPRLSLAKRAELYSIFWGRYAQITELYLDLAQALARLSFADEAYCQFDALVPSETSIINVKSLKQLSSKQDSTTRMMTASGTVADVPRSVATALIAELQIVMKDKPWDFFEHTDLLDFPGYRSRKPLRLARLLVDEPASTLSNMFLRGKVDFLFQRYNADQELTSMLLCVDDANPEVVSLPAVVESWIELTHGARPEDRVGKAVLLFFCLTKFDRQLIDMAGAAGNDEARFDSRLNSSLHSQFGRSPGTWPVSWTPDQPFSNSYWIRNPKYEGAAKIIESKDFHEIRMFPDAVPRVEELKNAYAGVEKVRMHFREPLRAWDEVLKLNDGGVGYLAENLAKVCLPDIKPRQLRARLDTVKRRVSERLSRYYVTTDLDKRVREREQVCEEILEHVEECVGRNRFGSFLAALCIDRVPLGNALYIARTTGVGPVGAAVDDASRGRSIFKGAITGRLGKKPVAAAAPDGPQTSNLRYGNVAVQTWANHMQTVSENESFARAVGIPTPMLREITAEMVAAARRKKLGEDIASRLDQILHIENSDAVVAKATVIASQLVNGFVTKFGYDRLPVARRPKLPDSGDPVFTVNHVLHDASSIGPESSNFAFGFAIDWCATFQVIIRENASSEDGSMLNLEQNARLGSILGKFIG